MQTAGAVRTGLGHLVLAGGSLTVIRKAQCWGLTAHRKLSAFYEQPYAMAIDKREGDYVLVVLNII